MTSSKKSPSKNILVSDHDLQKPPFKFLPKGRIYHFPDGGQWDAVHYERPFVLTLPMTKMTREGDFIVIEQRRFPAEQRMLVLPGGARDTNESAEDAARRELLEETGYEAESLELLIPECRLYPAGNTARVDIFLARDCVRAHEPTPDLIEEFNEMRTLEFSKPRIKREIAANATRLDVTLIAAISVLYMRDSLREFDNML